MARETLICLFSKNSSFLCKFRVPLSLHFSTSTENQPPVNIPTVYEYLLHKHDFSPQVASRVASVLTSFKDPQKSDSILLFLKENGFSKTQLERVVNSGPALLSANLEKRIKPRIKFFQDLGFSANEVAMIISNDPQIFTSSIVNRIIPSLSLLKGLFDSNVKVAKVLRDYRRFLSMDLENVLVPNVEFLKSLGIPMNQILRQLLMAPRTFSHKPENMRKFVEKADEMGVDRNSKLFMYAVRVLSTMNNETLEVKLKTLRDLGFSDDDILKVFRNAPLVLSVSVEKIKKVKEVLLETGKYDISSIVNNPTSLTYSVEKRYKPRLQVLVDLEKRNLIKKWPCLVALYVMPNKKFFQKFVAPYLDYEIEALIAKNVVRGKGELKIAQKDVNKLLRKST